MQDADAPRDSHRTSRGLGSSTRGLLLATLAIITPAGLVLVNVAAYVMSNLAAFRVAITVCAVVSTLVLNGLAAVSLFRVGEANWPNRWIFARHRRNGILAAFIFAMALGAAVAGKLTYSGLRDPKQLPNLSTFLAGLIGLAIPLALAFVLREDVSRRERRRYRTR